MGKRGKGQPAFTPTPGPFNAGLAGLAARKGDVPSVAAPAVAPVGAPPAKAAGRPPPARAVVRMERAGRGGRTVTVVEKLELRASELEEWLGDLKRALGCGGAVDGAALVLQGDVRERVGDWLARRGVRKVTLT